MDGDIFIGYPYFFGVKISYTAEAYVLGFGDYLINSGE